MKNIRTDIKEIMLKLSKPEIKIIKKGLTLKERLNNLEQKLRKQYVGDGTADTKEVKKLEKLIEKLKKEIADDDNL